MSLSTFVMLKKKKKKKKKKKSQLILFSVAQFGLKAYPPSGTPCSRSSETDVKLSLLLRTSSSSSSLPPPLPVSALLPPLLLLGVTGSITAADIWRANRGLRSNQLRASCLPWTFRGKHGKIRGVARYLLGPTFCFFWLLSGPSCAWMLHCRFDGAEQACLIVKACGQAGICGAAEKDPVVQVFCVPPLPCDCSWTAAALRDFLQSL